MKKASGDRKRRVKVLNRRRKVVRMKQELVPVTKFVIGLKSGTEGSDGRFEKSRTERGKV